MTSTIHHAPFTPRFGKGITSRRGPLVKTNPNRAAHSFLKPFFTPSHQRMIGTLAFLRKLSVNSPHGPTDQTYTYTLANGVRPGIEQSHLYPTLAPYNWQPPLPPFGDRRNPETKVLVDATPSLALTSSLVTITAITRVVSPPHTVEQRSKVTISLYGNSYLWKFAARIRARKDTRAGRPSVIRFCFLSVPPTKSRQVRGYAEKLRPTAYNNYIPNQPAVDLSHRSQLQYPAFFTPHKGRGRNPGSTAVDPSRGEKPPP